MSEYKIHQLVYTKLNPEDSPFKKKDFHTAFYPLDFISGTELMIIENHIYIPTVNSFLAKQVVYFHKVREETYLFVFEIRSLPGEVDTMGRGGIFICHVFIFPQALWQKLPVPARLMELVAGNQYHSRAELLNSSYIDRQSGNMKPIELAADEDQLKDNQIPALDGNFEIQLGLYLLDSLKQENKDHKFMFSAKEPGAREMFNKLICYLPNEQKVNIGWDTMFDGGRMMDYNKIFVAYSERAPKGGSGSSIVHLSALKTELAKDFKITEKQNPYAQWIAGCSSSIKDHYFVEEAFKLSEALEAKEKYDLPDNWNLGCFASVNKELVDKLFLERCKKVFRRKISKELCKIVPGKDKLLFVFDKLDFSKFAEYLLQILENNRISAWRVKNGIPHNFIIHSPVLILIEQLWQKDKFDVAAFNKLTDNEKLQLNKYVLKTSVIKKNWYLELIKNDEKLLNFYTRHYPKPRRIIKYFRSVLSLNEREINQLGFEMFVIRKVFYFRAKHFFGKITGVFGRKKGKRDI